MEVLDQEKFRSLGLPADDPFTAHLEKLISQNEAFIEEEPEATYIRLKGAEERLWIKASESLAALADSVNLEAGADPGHWCGTADVEPDFSLETVSDANKLRSKSKYYLGSTIVNVVFLSSPNVTWKPGQQSTFISQMMNTGHAILNRVGRNDGLPFPKHEFRVTSEDFSFAIDPPVVPVRNPKDPSKISYDDIGVNIKAYLKHKSVYHGDVYNVNNYPRQPDVLQALHELINLLRDKYEKDWGYLVFVVPDPLNKGREHAFPESGFMVLFDKSPTKVHPWTVAHEALHMYGAKDESVDSPKTPEKINACRARTGGLYDVPNTNCETADGNGCIMSSYLHDPKVIARERVCTVTALQLSLTIGPDGVYKPINDFALNLYDLNDNYFKYEGGVFLLSDAIRKNRQVLVQVEGSSKMNPVFSGHGPEGDLRTIVGADHLLPAHPFSCAIAKWVSIDGTYHSPWFYIGKGGQWLTAPFTAHLVFNINDSKRNFGDNSGRMRISVWSRLSSNNGPAYVQKAIWPNDAIALFSNVSRLATFAELGIAEPE